MKKGLGKGLDTLFSKEDTIEDKKEGIVELPINSIEPNKNQPRKSFDKEKLEALANSIQEQGMISPIIVVKNDNSTYTIVAGERRWRAAKLCKLKKIPVIIKDYSSQTVAEIALVENLQREDLNPIEEALAYRELSETFGLTQEEISKKVGKSRSGIANSMRLLGLEDELQAKVVSGEISEGHARVALSLDGFVLREFFINQIIENGLNVRQAEKLAKQLVKPKKEKIKTPSVEDIEFKKLEETLSGNFGTKVSIKNGAKKGKIEIEYYGNDDLERILNILNNN